MGLIQNIQRPKKNEKVRACLNLKKLIIRFYISNPVKKQGIKKKRLNLCKKAKSWIN